MAVTRTAPDHDTRLVAILMALATTSQFALSLVTPALPSIGRDLGAPAGASSTISAFLAGYGVGQLFYGPLSDRFGRLPVLLAGLGLFIAFSLVCAIAPTIDVLLVARVLQGFGAGACFVLSRAIARDRLDGPALTRALSLMAIGGGLLPALGPPLGAWLLAAVGWRGSFVASALFGAVLLGSAQLWLRETSRSRLEQLAPATILHAFRTVGLDPEFLGPTLAGGCAFAGMYGFYTLAPTVLIDATHMPPTVFGYLFATASVAYLAGITATRQLVSRLGERSLLRAAQTVMVVASIVGLGLSLWLDLSPATVMAPALAYIVGLGMQTPIVGAIALRGQVRHAGVAAALFGCGQVLLSAAWSSLAGMAGLAPGLDIAASMLVMASLSALALLISWRSWRRGTIC